MDRYDICLGSEILGQATVERQGLYFKIVCRCHLSGQTRFRVSVAGSGGEEDLGLLIPQGSGFGLTKSVAVKKLGEQLRFQIVPAHVKPNGSFIPLCPDEPFRYLERIKSAVLSRKDGQVGLLLQGVSKDSSKPTGQ